MKLNIYVYLYPFDSAPSFLIDITIWLNTFLHFKGLCFLLIPDSLIPQTLTLLIPDSLIPQTLTLLIPDSLIPQTLTF